MGRYPIVKNVEMRRLQISDAPLSQFWILIALLRSVKVIFGFRFRYSYIKRLFSHQFWIFHDGPGRCGKVPGSGSGKAVRHHSETEMRQVS